MKIAVVCGTPGCVNNGQEFSAVFVVGATAEHADEFLESFGHGSESDADYCPECGQLGIAQDPEDEDAP